MRFYFAFIFANRGTIERIGEEQFFRTRVESALVQFVSRRFESQVLQYFHRKALKGEYPDIEDFGTYWFDDPETRTSGEFDCVLKHTGERYSFYECKYYDRPMTLKVCEQEERQLNAIENLEISEIGFVCSSGFSFEDNAGYSLITGEKLYEG